MALISGPISPSLHPTVTLCPRCIEQKCYVFSCLLASAHTVPETGMPLTPGSSGEDWLRSAQCAGVSSLRSLPESSEWWVLFSALWTSYPLAFVRDYFLTYLLWIRSSLRLGRMSYQFLKLWLLERKYSMLTQNMWFGVGHTSPFSLLTSCVTLEKLLNL